MLKEHSAIPRIGREHLVALRRRKYLIKWKVSRDFLLLIFFMNQFPNFFENSRRYSQVSKTPAANFSTIFASVVDTFFLCRPFMIFEGCLDSNQECCRSKLARYRLSHPSHNTGGKFETGIGGLGETDSWKNQKQKISWHCPLGTGWLPDPGPTKDSQF